MKEFDFEELDRAVNSAIGTDSSPPPPSPSDSPVDTPTRGVAVPSRESFVPPRTDSADSPASRRSSGRFMDVMHPSSDMRSGGVAPQELTPSTDLPAPEETLDSPEVEAPVAESPFLPDAVVEKRPLGAMPPVGETVSEVADQVGAAPAQELLEEGEETPLLEAGDETPSSMAVTDTHQPEISADTEPKPLYDTETYHQPAGTVVPKKKSGLRVAVWALLLVLLGAAAGAAVYFFVLPLL